MAFFCSNRLIMTPWRSRVVAVSVERRKRYNHCFAKQWKGSLTHVLWIPASTACSQKLSKCSVFLPLSIEHRICYSFLTQYVALCSREWHREHGHGNAVDWKSSFPMWLKTITISDAHSGSETFSGGNCVWWFSFGDPLFHAASARLSRAKGEHIMLRSPPTLSPKI